MGFEKCDYEHTLFIKTDQRGKILIVSVYVDDLMYTGTDPLMFTSFVSSMKQKFDMTDLGNIRYFLGLEVLQFPNNIFISQRKYALEVVKRFGMNDSNSVKNPIVPGVKISKDIGSDERVDKSHYEQLVGSLMYLTTATRLNLSYVVGLFSRYMENPSVKHKLVAKRVLRYLKGTAHFGIRYKKGKVNELIAYTDSNYAGDIDDRKSTSGYVFMFSSGAVSWSSKKQPVVSLSTTEAEFIAAAAYLHGRSKHINVRFHFLREMSKDGIINLVYCASQEQLADLMTKPLKLGTFLELRKSLGVCSELEVNCKSEDKMRSCSLREDVEDTN
ncbi:uncharacterized mitochondrial protein AtMg00810-like [Vicia villosa]|uniref:uncharacterized mitochondrial protein AtMg00810-like n=1 Tax=Vicia villosa TaxID=3911 RepID=UPI00273BCE6F|nr:uncharacterized mitochondrial protein AtMg00810-like [Vicia villosa]